jgi:hypothetical protein
MDTEKLFKEYKYYIDYFINHYEKHRYLIHALDHNYDNIKFADTKAGALVGGVVLLISLLSTKEKGILEVWEAITPVTRYIGGFLIIAFFCSLVICLWFSFWVIFPRYKLPVSLEKSPKGEDNRGKAPDGIRFSPPGLFWSRNVVGYKDPAVYFHSVDKASEEDIIQDLSNEIYKLSGILDEKLKQLSRAIVGFYAMFIFWVLLIVLIWLNVKG